MRITDEVIQVRASQIVYVYSHLFKMTLTGDKLLSNGKIPTDGVDMHRCILIINSIRLAEL